MAFDPLAWALGFVGRGVIKKILEAFSDDELTKSLSAALNEWAREVAAAGVEVEARALTERFFSEAPDESPKRAELRAFLERKDLPDSDVWFAALYERWEQVRQDLGEDAQEFFRLEAVEAEKLLRRLALRFERACQRNRDMFQHAVLQRLKDLTEPVRLERIADARVGQAREAFVIFSKPLLNWPTTLRKTGDHIARPQLQEIVTRISQLDSSTTIILGPRGTGKSALLASVGTAAAGKGWTVFAIKADLLTERSDEEIAWKLNLAQPLHAVLTASASEIKTVVIIDQLDAVAEILDRTTEKLNFILNLVQRLSGVRNIHIVLSSREFDFRTDSRLRTIGADEVRLESLAWGDVARVLTAAGHEPERYGDELRNLLRNPWALNLYLEVAEPNESFASLTAVLERLWYEQVTFANDARDRERLLSRISEVMTEEEQLSVPTAIADEWPDARRGLLHDGILVQEGTSIGFRHQTFYEFIIARRFARGDADFLAHILARQDGLFVRPTVFATLLYMRDAAPRRYAAVTQELLENREVRLHVRSLVFDFVGSQREPRDVEIECLLPLLSDQRVGPRLLGAAAGSPGWFTVLGARPEFREWMRGDRAYLTLSVLTAAVHFAPDSVLALVEDEWLPTTRYDGLIAQILQEFTAFNTRPRRIAMTISRRSDFQWLIDHVASFNAAAAVDMVVADLRRQLETGAGVDVLESDQRHELLEELAHKEPSHFLKSVWPAFLAVIDAAAQEPVHANSYRHVWELEIYREYRPGGAVIDALRLAARQMAQSDPEAFQQFVTANESSDVLLAHIIFCDGLEILAQTNPAFVLEYILRDGRRLALGLESRRHSVSASLISAIYPQLDPAERSRLEAAVTSFTMYAPVPDDDAEKKKIAVKWNRQHRLHLLSALTEELLPDSLRRLIGEEQRRFPNFRDHEPLIRGGVVGARMRANEMERASDNDLLNLFQEITDASDERWIGSTRDISRAGGSGELARELENMSKKDPARSLRLLPHLTPGKHQKYAAAIITALAESKNVRELEALIGDLESRGFASEEFRTEVSSALAQRAKSDGGLSDAAINMLRRWLAGMPPGTSESVIVGQSAQGSIVFAHQLILFGGTSRARVVSAISSGLLARRPPEIARWLGIVRAEIARNERGAFWEQVISDMVTPLNESAAEANQVLDEVFTAHPQLFERQAVLWFLGRFMSRLDPAHARRWLEQIRSLSSDQQQAYGELLVLYDAWHSDGWSRGELESFRRGGEGRILTGLGWASEYVWALARLRPIMADLLIRYAAAATEQDSPLLARFLTERMDDESIDTDTERVVRAIAANDALVVKLAPDLLALLEPHAIRRPDLAAMVTKRILDVAGNKLSDVTTVGGYLAADLTSITLTLHRQAKYRHTGLELFERMIELDVREAQAALELLDRRPTRRHPAVLSHRRRRRGRRRPQRP